MVYDATKAELKVILILRTEVILILTCREWRIELSGPSTHRLAFLVFLFHILSFLNTKS